MYESFYGFSRRPFTAIPDADCYVPLASAQEALAELLLCVQQGDGIAVLTSPAGLGKSLLCRQLAELLKEQFEPVVLPQAGFDTPRSLLQSVLYELGTAWSGMTENEMRLELKTQLAEAAGEGRPVVLIFDEAHLLQPALLEEIRCLANLEQAGKPQARIVLSGQLELEETLAAPGLEAFNQRIRCQTALPPLSQLESAEYLLGRLQQVGTDLAAVFSREAVQLICRASDGNPRCLNQLSDQALLLGYISEEMPISEETVRDALDDLRQLPLHWNIPAQSESSFEAEEADSSDIDQPAAEAAEEDFLEEACAETGADEIGSDAEPEGYLADPAEDEYAGEMASFEVGEPETAPQPGTAGQAEESNLPTADAEAEVSEADPTSSPVADFETATPAEALEVGVFECGAGDEDGGIASSDPADETASLETASLETQPVTPPQNLRPQVSEEAFTADSESSDADEAEPEDDAAAAGEAPLIVSPSADGLPAERRAGTDDELTLDDDTHCIEFGVSDGDEVEDWTTGEWTSFDSRKEADELAELLTFDSHLSPDADSVDFGAEPAAELPVLPDESSSDFDWELQLELAESGNEAELPPAAAEIALPEPPELDPAVPAGPVAATPHTVIDTELQQPQDLVLPAGDGWVPVEAVDASTAPGMPAADDEVAADSANTDETDSGQLELNSDSQEELPASDDAVEEAATEEFAEELLHEAAVEAPEDSPIAAQSALEEAGATSIEEAGDQTSDEPTKETAAEEPVGGNATAGEPVTASQPSGWEPVELQSRRPVRRDDPSADDSTPAKRPTPARLGSAHETSGQSTTTGAPVTIVEQEVLDSYARLDSGRPAEGPDATSADTQDAGETHPAADVDASDAAGTSEADALPEVNEAAPGEATEAAGPTADSTSEPAADELQESVPEMSGSEMSSPVSDEPDAAAGSSLPARSIDPLETLDRASRLVEEALEENATEAPASREPATSDTVDLDEAACLTPLSSTDDELEAENPEDSLTAETEASPAAGQAPAETTAAEISAAAPEENPLEEQIGRMVLETSFDAQRVVEQRLDQMIAGQRQAHRPEVNDWEPVTPAAEGDEEPHEPAAPPFDIAPLTEPVTPPAASPASEQLSEPRNTATAPTADEQPQQQSPEASGQPHRPGTGRRFARLFTDLRHRASKRGG